MDFGDFLQAVMHACDSDPERAKPAQTEWENLSKRPDASGHFAAEARLALT
ncbi:hypothetical protein [Paracoccus sp. (in: a-proteobacteria)]|uniref:hypothetical protein n=1 Tax=Paracoccus sp. TaxID=267 RepID=UPI00321F7477